jgi:hypothetical protein
MTIKLRPILIFAFAALLVLSLGLAVNVAGQRSRGEKDSAKETMADDQWEYLIVSGGNQNLSSLSGEQFSGLRKQPDNSFREAFVVERNFDKLGAKGWQLVSVHGAPNDPIYYFKRPKEVR